MKFMFRNKLYRGTKDEIKGQVIIDLRDLLDYDIEDIKAVVNLIPDTYDFNIGMDTICGTKSEILEQFLRGPKGCSNSIL